MIDKQYRSPKLTRAYRLRARAESQERTRRRIVEAAVGLHQSIGPLATTVSELARAAGVTRLTVYRHFPDESALLGACAGLFLSQHPLPDVEAWAQVANPWRRLERALRELYAFWRSVAPMARTVLRDAQAAPGRFGGGFEHLAAEADRVLAAGLPRSRLARAALRYAVRFPTWDALTEGGELPDRAAVTLALELLKAAART